MSDFKPKDFTGSMFVQENKKSPSHPDFNGSVMITGKEFWVSGWLKQNGSGNDFISLSFSPKLPKGEKQEFTKGKKDDNVGSLSFEENKSSANAPDAKGEITVEGRRWKIACWDKISQKSGKPWKSLSITDPNTVSKGSDRVTGEKNSSGESVDRSFGFPMDPGMDGYEEIPL